MKKTFFLLILSLFSLFSFSQTIVRTSKNQSGTYDEYFKKWRFSEFIHSDISIRLEPGRFVFDDENRSVYTVKINNGEKIEESVRYSAWTCSDEKGRECIVQLISYKEAEMNVLSVVYQRICYVYYISEVKTYPQN